MMKTLKVWLGRFESSDALQAYFAETRDKTENLPMNAFAADQGQGFYDHDWLERHFVQDAKLDDLVYGPYGFGRKALALQVLAVEQGIDDANTLIVADASLIESPKSVQGSNYTLWYMGKFTERMSVKRYLDPKKTPQITDESYWLTFPENQAGIDALHAEADSGNYNAVAKLHLIYSAGINTAHDKNKASRMMTRSYFMPDAAHACYTANAENGLPEGWRALTFLHGSNPTTPDEDKLRYLQRGADAGVLDSQTFLADAYKTGKYGLPQDWDQAEHWLLKAADEHAQANVRFKLYRLYDRRGRPGDAQKAFHWLREEAHATGAEAVLGYLGSRYQSGEGVEADTGMHLMYLYLSCCQDDEVRKQTLRHIELKTKGCTAAQLADGRERAKAWLMENGASLIRFKGDLSDPFEAFI